MANQTKFLTFTMAGCLTFFVGMFSPTLGIEDPLQTILLLGALILMGIGFWFSRRLKEDNKEAAVQPRVWTQQQKAGMFVVMVVITGIVTVSAPFWLPLTTPDIPPLILWAVPLAYFPILVAVFWYVIFKKIP